MDVYDVSTAKLNKVNNTCIIFWDALFEIMNVTFNDNVETNNEEI